MTKAPPPSIRSTLPDEAHWQEPAVIRDDEPGWRISHCEPEEGLVIRTAVVNQEHIR